MEQSCRSSSRTLTRRCWTLPWQQLRSLLRRSNKKSRRQLKKSSKRWTKSTCLHGSASLVVVLKQGEYNLTSPTHTHTLRLLTELFAHLTAVLNACFPRWYRAAHSDMHHERRVTHETKHFAYFYIGALAVLIFRTADNTPLPIGI